MKNKTGCDGAGVSQLLGPLWQDKLPLKCLSLAPSLTQNTGFVCGCQLWHNVRFIFIKSANHNVLFCFQFSLQICCPLRADSFKISSEQSETLPTPPVSWNNVYVAAWMMCQHMNSWPLLGLISTIYYLLHAQSNQRQSNRLNSVGDRYIAAKVCPSNGKMNKTNRLKELPNQGNIIRLSVINEGPWEKILSTWDVWPTLSLIDTCNLTGPVFWSPWQSASHSSVCVRQEMQVEIGTALIYTALLIIKACCYPEVFTVTEGQSNSEDTARGLCSGAQGV